MKEVWKSLRKVVEFGTYYKVSNLGRVKSVDRMTNGAKSKGQIMKLRKDKDGYLMVNLSEKGKKKTYKVHRLVALAFLENPTNRPEVNHKSGDKADNTVDNLEWVTSKANMRHAHKNGLIAYAKGVKNSNAKLNDEKVLEIRQLYRTGKYTYKQIAEKFDISESSAYNVVRRKRWKHV